jgi:hypothetical protein
MAMPMIGAMTIATHEITLAMVSNVSPWNNEACACDGIARNAKAMNGTECP